MSRQSTIKLQAILAENGYTDTQLLEHILYNVLSGSSLEDIAWLQ